MSLPFWGEVLGPPDGYRPQQTKVKYREKTSRIDSKQTVKRSDARRVTSLKRTARSPPTCANRKRLDSEPNPAPGPESPRACSKLAMSLFPSGTHRSRVREANLNYNRHSSGICLLKSQPTSTLAGPKAPKKLKQLATTLWTADSARSTTDVAKSGQTSGHRFLSQSRAEECRVRRRAGPGEVLHLETSSCPIPHKAPGGGGSGRP